MAELIQNDGNGNRDLLLVTFGGCNSVGGVSGETPFEFVKTLSEYFPKADKRFYRDLYSSHYRRGLKDITTGVDDTVQYLRPILSQYKKIAFIGTSSGGYASILFGSLLNVNYIFAFFPQTIIKNVIDTRYNDLLPLINKVSKYFLVGIPQAQSGLHDFKHVSRLSHFENVFINKNANIKKFRDEGRLKIYLQINICIEKKYTYAMNKLVSTRELTNYLQKNLFDSKNIEGFDLNKSLVDNVKCKRETCVFQRHTLIQNNNEGYCCRACQIDKGHGRHCEKKK